MEGDTVIFLKKIVFPELIVWNWGPNPIYFIVKNSVMITKLQMFDTMAVLSHPIRAGVCHAQQNHSLLRDIQFFYISRLFE